MATKFANSSWAFEIPKNKPAPTTATLGRTTTSGITPNTGLEILTSGKPSATLDAAAKTAAQYNQNVSNAAAAEPVYSTGSAGVGASDAEYTAAINKALERQIAAADAAYKQGKANLDTAKESALRNNYISYMQGVKNLPQISAVAGSGGTSESLATKHQLNFENNRNSIEQQYLADLLGLQTNHENNIVTADQDYLTRLMSLYKPATTKSSGTQSQLTGYKVNGKTMSKEEYLAYLANLGMSAEEAYTFMKNNNILY